MADSQNWPVDKRLLAGERNCMNVPGCDIGNSPVEYTSELIRGKRLFISTSNGTRALQRVEKASAVIVAAQINRHSAVCYLLKKQPETVWLVASGREGSYSLEDSACAGAIAELLLEKKPNGINICNDEALAALALYQQWKSNMIGLFHKSSHGQRLLKLQCSEDLIYCSQTDILNVLPIQISPGLLIKSSE